jgi:hypothetical protein
MKKTGVILVVFGGLLAVLAFHAVRSEQIINLQKRSLQEMAARVKRLEQAPVADAQNLPGGPSGGLSFSLTGDSSEADLRLELQNLRAKIDALQLQLKSGGAQKPLTGWSGQPAPGQINPVPLPRASIPGPAEVPESWTPFEFNGATYYKVPLAYRN